MAKTEEDLWTALDEANQSRARLYVEFFKVIEARLGRAEATDLCKAAIRNWGRGLAVGLETHCPNDFAGLCKSFALAPDDGPCFPQRLIVVTRRGSMSSSSAARFRSPGVQPGLAMTISSCCVKLPVKPTMEH